MRQDQYRSSLVYTETEAQRGGASFPTVTQLVNDGAVIPTAIWLQSNIVQTRAGDRPAFSISNPAFSISNPAIY